MYYGYNDVVREVDWGDVFEYADKTADKGDLEMLRAIADSKETIVRFEGDDYIHDFTVSDSDKKAIRETLKVYDALASE